MKRAHGLSAQMVTGMIGLVLLSAVAAGLSAIWLLQQEQQRHGSALLDQGIRASRTLYAAAVNEVDRLAMLTAQRPTVRSLVANDPDHLLTAYLEQLLVGTDLDMIVLCDAAGKPLASSGQDASTDWCAQTRSVGWLAATEPILGPDGGHMGIAWVGIRLDDQWARQMRLQTGLEHTLFANDVALATSLTGQEPAEPNSGSEQTTYLTSRFSLGDRHLEFEVALDVTAAVERQRRLAWSLAGFISAIALVTTSAGALLAHRIGRPLKELAEAATRLSNGDLTRPAAVDTRVREVDLAARALEGARADLLQTLTELRNEKEWTDHLLEAIVEGIMTLDHHGRITFFSHGAERVTGWQRDQVVGRPCDQVFPVSDTTQPFSQFIPAPGLKRKIPVKLPAGREAVLAFTGARLTPVAGGGDRVALVFRDVSEEEAVRRLLAHFLANVSHEFRTPLSALAASVELLLDQAAYLSATELGELLTTLHLGVLGLQTLVDNLLETASIEAGRFRVAARPTDLKDIIAEAVGMMQPLLRKHYQRLAVDLPAAIPMIEADPRRIAQVLVNLLSNASRYGPDHAEITVNVTSTDTHARVAVTDQGAGIPPGRLGDLYRGFALSGEGNDQIQVGVGLGLSVVKAIVQAHDGQVGVSGSTFWFTLPLHRPASGAANRADETAAEEIGSSR